VLLFPGLFSPGFFFAIFISFCIVRCRIVDYKEESKMDKKLRPMWYFDAQLLNFIIHTLVKGAPERPHISEVKILFWFIVCEFMGLFDQNDSLEEGRFRHAKSIYVCAKGWVIAFLDTYIECRHHFVDLDTLSLCRRAASLEEHLNQVRLLPAPQHTSGNS